MRTGIDFLAQMIGEPIIESFIDASLPVEDRMACDICGRPSEEWLDPTRHLLHTSYPGAPEVHCTSCHVLFASAPLHFGPGRIGKLGMLRGAGCFISASSKIIYATGKYFDRFTAVEAPLFDEIVPLSGISIIADALNRIQPSEPFILITDLGVKKSSLVENLFVSRSPDRICVSSEKEHHWLRKSELVLPEDLSEVPAKVLTQMNEGWLDLLLLRTKQNLTHSQLRVLASHIKSYPQLEAATKRLPRDPHTRAYALRVTRRMLGENA